jgi:hypothetical protein
VFCTSVVPQEDIELTKIEGLNPIVGYSNKDGQYKFETNPVKNEPDYQLNLSFPYTKNEDIDIRNVLTKGDFEITYTIKSLDAKGNITDDKVKMTPPDIVSVITKDSSTNITVNFNFSNLQKGKYQIDTQLTFKAPTNQNFDLSAWNVEIAPQEWVEYSANPQVENAVALENTANLRRNFIEPIENLRQTQKDQLISAVRITLDVIY